MASWCHAAQSSPFIGPGGQVLIGFSGPIHSTHTSGPQRNGFRPAIGADAGWHLFCLRWSPFRLLFLQELTRDTASHDFAVPKTPTHRLYVRPQPRTWYFRASDIGHSAKPWDIHRRDCKTPEHARLSAKTPFGRIGQGAVHLRFRVPMFLSSRRWSERLVEDCETGDPQKPSIFNRALNTRGSSMPMPVYALCPRSTVVLLSESFD